MSGVLNLGLETQCHDMRHSTGSLKMNPKSGLICKTDPNMLVIMFSALILYRVQVLVLQSKH